MQAELCSERTNHRSPEMSGVVNWVRTNILSPMLSPYSSETFMKSFDKAAKDILFDEMYKLEGRFLKSRERFGSRNLQDFRQRELYLLPIAKQTLNDELFKTQEIRALYDILNLRIHFLPLKLLVPIFFRRYNEKIGKLKIAISKAEEEIKSMEI
ncbi:MAG: hypothetical protein WCO33_01030 [bacterium]